MYLEELINQINFVDDDFTFRLGMRDMFAYVTAKDFKEDFYGRAFYFGEELEGFDDEEEMLELDISKLKVREINIMSTPLMVSIELDEEVDEYD